MTQTNIPTDKIELAIANKTTHVWVTENINGDIIGISTSKERALEIFVKRYGYEPYGIDPKIHTFELNKFYYA